MSATHTFSRIVKTCGWIAASVEVSQILSHTNRHHEAAFGK